MNAVFPAGGVATRFRPPGLVPATATGPPPSPAPCRGRRPTDHVGSATTYQAPLGKIHVGWYRSPMLRERKDEPDDRRRRQRRTSARCEHRRPPHRGTRRKRRGEPTPSRTVPRTAGRPSTAPRGIGGREVGESRTGRTGRGKRPHRSDPNTGPTDGEKANYRTTGNRSSGTRHTPNWPQGRLKTSPVRVQFAAPAIL
jgi:hypothetical protein